MSQPATLSRRLASWAFDVQYLDETVASDVRRRLLDSVGIMLAASVASEEAAAVRGVVESTGGIGRSLVIGGDMRLPASSAALVNGTLAHALDFDDTHLPSVLHPSATVVPAVLAVAEEEGVVDTARLLTAIAVGIEVTNRIGMGSYDPQLRNSTMFEHGFHATSICGAIGAAVATAILTELPQEGIANSMAIAASMGSGILEANRTGGSVKKTHCGWAAHAGIHAMRFSAAGITGAPTAFEGRFGFYEAFAHGYLDEDAVIGDLGIRWELLRTHFKPYPSNHFTHAAIDAARRLLADGLRVEEIEEIRLGVAAPTLRTIAEPPDIKARPATPYAAQFSGPFVLARALLSEGGLGLYLDDFTDSSIMDPETLDLAARVSCFADEEATSRFPQAFPAVVTVRTSTGRRWEARIDNNRGGPEFPLSDDELFHKFMLNAGQALEVERAENIGHLILSLGSGSASELFDALGSNRA